MSTAQAKPSLEESFSDSLNINCGLIVNASFDVREIARGMELLGLETAANQLFNAIEDLRLAEDGLRRAYAAELTRGLRGAERQTADLLLAFVDRLSAESAVPTNEGEQT